MLHNYSEGGGGVYVLFMKKRCQEIAGEKFAFNRQGYILTNLINMSVKFFSTVSIVFFSVDFKSARYHSRF